MPFTRTHDETVEHYATMFNVSSDGVYPTDENIKRVLSACGIPPEREWYEEIRADVISRWPGGRGALRESLRSPADRADPRLLANYAQVTPLAREYVALMRRGDSRQGKDIMFTLSSAVDHGYTSYDLCMAERNDPRWMPLGWDGYQAAATIRELSQDL